MLEGLPPAGPPQNPSSFQQGQRSRKTPGAPGARKRQAGAAGQVCAQAVFTDTWQLTSDKMSNKNWL